MRRLVRKGLRAATGVMVIVIVPLQIQASCFTNCAPSRTTNLENSSIGYFSNDTRDRSHNFGNNSTAILGDVNIHVGHKRIEISGMSHSERSLIDASVSSVVNIGNVGP